MSNNNVTAVNVIERTTKQMSIRELAKQWNAGAVEFPPIQRNYVWGELQSNDEGTETQSDWIHSLAINFPAPPVLVNKIKREVEGRGGKMVTKTIYRFLDGQQRSTTSIDFVQETAECEMGGFFLNYETDPVILQNAEGEIEEHKVAGVFFKELSQDVKDMILDYSLTMIVMEDLTEDQEELVFKRFNQGMALTKIEDLRAEVGSKTTAFINELSATDFWKNIAGLSKKQQNRFVDFELILQTAMVVSESKFTEDGWESVHIGFSDAKKSKPVGIDSWAMKYKENGLPQELMDKLKVATAYLEQAFPEKETKYHKKSNMPMMVLLALRAIEDGMDSNHFASLVDEFHINAKEGKQDYPSNSVYTEYKTVSASKTADKANVETRLNSIFAFYNDYSKDWKVEYLSPTERKDKKKAEAHAKKEREKIQREADRAKKADAMANEDENDMDQRMKDEEAAKQAALAAALAESASENVEQPELNLDQQPA